MAKGTKTPIREEFSEAVSFLRSHPLFETLCYEVTFVLGNRNEVGSDFHAAAYASGFVKVHPTRQLGVQQWIYVLAHALLHFGFDHFREMADVLWNQACNLYIRDFLKSLKVGIAPEDMDTSADATFGNEEKYLDALYRKDTESLKDLRVGTAGKHPDMVFDHLDKKKRDARLKAFAEGLTKAVIASVEVANGVRKNITSTATPRSLAEKARQWFISSYPLLGALAAQFKLYENLQLARTMAIDVAAINPYLKEIYFNPTNLKSEAEYRFVMAHEILHASLRHDLRQAGRDPYFWNIACDYVVNGWLIEMKIGAAPEVGFLYDEELKGFSAESIYDRIVTDLRRYRKLRTMRGMGASDILDSGAKSAEDYMRLDEFYRRCLLEGLSYHEAGARGFLPLGLVEEIKALAVPPVPWDVELAHWFENWFPLEESRRTFARISRRQSSTPDIPRPKYVRPEIEAARTFGVILDTSGSMDRVLLGRALGAIMSYSIQREVPYVRLVYCDAHPYDQGYVDVTNLADYVKVIGRGGTKLQPGISLVEKAKDFPEKGPLLIITDGFTDNFRVTREHAYLMPRGASLPFAPKGRVFYVG